MNDLTVVIPSYGRADSLPGADYFDFAKYVVPESQADDYERAVGGDRLITLPDSEDGSIVKKRNWIMRNLPRPLMMLDDDVKRITYTEFDFDEDGTPINNGYRTYPQEEVEDLFIKCTNLCYQFGSKMWGVNQNTDPMNYKPYRPFSLTNPVLGPLQGHLDHDLLFDQRVGTKDDYDMSLQQIHTFGKVLRFNKFAYDCRHGDNSGGIVSQRHMQKEITYCEAIMNKWGKDVIEYELPPEKMSDLLNAKKVNVPIGNV
ncbi:hypothetical protein [Fodinibius sp.]|uniref:GREB1-related protein n=1 Tax=Fodinibius sp. TaxID=1872440 RepID=UPI002ACD5A7E|nr:hypothetical protein [Fodinibius sp.]MDZ7658065.1 hypothetical protein [Fodinibius sp.]